MYVTRREPSFIRLAGHCRRSTVVFNAMYTQRGGHNRETVRRMRDAIEMSPYVSIMISSRV